MRSPSESVLADPAVLRRAALDLDTPRAAEARDRLAVPIDALIERARQALVRSPEAAVDDLLASDAIMLQGGDAEAHADLLQEASRRIRHRLPVHAALLDFKRARAIFLRGGYEEALAVTTNLDRRLKRLGGADAPFPIGGWPPSPFAVRVRSVTIASATERFLGQYDRAHRRCEAFAAEAEGHPFAALYIAFHRGTACIGLGRPDAAEADLRRALTLGHRLGASRLRALAFANLGEVFALRGETPAALGWTMEARSRLQALGDPMMVGKVLSMEARHLAALGHAEAAEARAEASYQLGVAVADFETQAEALTVGSSRAPGAAEQRAARRQALDWDLTALGWERLASRLRRLDVDPQGRRLEVRGGDVRLCTPHGQRTIDLHRRPVLRRVLEVLIQAQLHALPGVSAEGLLSAGWPDERPDHHSGLNRVYATVRALRSAGLRDVLQRGPAGYRLTCPVQRI